VFIKGLPYSADDAQLRKDHAPIALRTEEKNLLDQAESNVENVKQGIELANNLLKKQLKEKNVPDDARNLLLKAVADARQSLPSLPESAPQRGQAAALAKTTPSKDRATSERKLHSYEEGLPVTHKEQTKIKDTRFEKAQAFKAYEEGLSKVAQEEQTVLKDTQFVKARALKVLKDSHASPIEQKEVDGLLGKALNLEYKELSMEKKSLNDAKKLFATKRHGHGKKSLAKGVDELNSNKLLELERENTALSKKNAALRKEHDYLENAANAKKELLLRSIAELSLENKKLQAENNQLEDELH